MTRTLPCRVGVTPAPAPSSWVLMIYLNEANVTLCRAAGDSSELDCPGWGLDLPPCDGMAPGPSPHWSAWVE